jgi:hypothetical protein
VKIRKLICILLCTTSLCAQSVTSVEQYGPVAAIDVYNGLGTNITSTNAWEYVAAQAAHITWGRFDASWTVTELQTCPANTSGGYTLNSTIAAGLTNGAAHGVRPMLNGLWGPTYCSIATGTVTSNVSIGATTVAMTVSTGSLSNVVNGSSALELPSGFISTQHGYAGTIITGVAGSTITLASAATQAVSAGTALTVNLLLYPPVLVAPGTSYTANASVQAYYNYVNYLATQIVAAGLTGRIELWNEPPWSDECWDSIARCYTTPPANNAIDPAFGVELPAYLASRTPPTGVKWNNGYSDNAGADGSMLSPLFLSSYPTPTTTIKNFAGESMHPYGNNPEDDLWSPACIHNNRDETFIMQNCGVLGGNSGSSYKWMAAFNAFPYTFGGLQPSITETGLQTNRSPTTTLAQQAQFELRQFLSYSGAGVNPVIFYRLFDNSGQGFGWFASQGNPNPVYTTFLNYMTDLSPIANSPVLPYSACMMPRVSSYTGFYPLATTMFVGSRTGDRSNSIMFSMWQRTYSAGQWVSLASPVGVSVSVVVPAGMTVSWVRDHVAGTSPSFTFSGGVLTVNSVADDPIDSLLVPISTSPTLVCT